VPNRFIKESTCVSESLNSISAHAERLFWRLVVKADDYGLYLGTTKIIKNTCLPLLADVIKDAQIESWITELEQAKQIFRYKSKTDDKVYLKLTNWEDHQQTRATKPKYPQPEDDEIICNQLISIDNNCSSRACARRMRIPNTDNVKRIYGEFNNVLLTDIEISKLQEDIPNYQQYIRDLSEYIESKGVKYQSHYATIRQWYSRDKKQGKVRTEQTESPQKRTRYKTIIDENGKEVAVPIE